MSIAQAVESALLGFRSQREQGRGFTNLALYAKPITLQVSEFLFGDGFAVAPGDKWRVRRRAVAPSLHKTYLQTMIDRVFGSCAKQLNSKLEVGVSLLIQS